MIPCFDTERQLASRPVEPVAILCSLLYNRSEVDL